jgi:hypothetical protein
VKAALFKLLRIVCVARSVIKYQRWSLGKTTLMFQAIVIFVVDLCKTFVAGVQIIMFSVTIHKNV